MSITINGNGTITGISVGGLPDGIVDTDMIANNAVTNAKATGIAGGKILQVVTADTSTQVHSSSYTPTSTGLSATITPSSTSSKVYIATSSNINMLGDGTSSSGRQIYLWLSRNGIHNTGTTIQAIRIGLSASGSHNTAPENNEIGSFAYLDSPNTTSATSYHVSFGKYDNNVQMLAQKGSVYKSTMVLMEVAA